MIGWAYYNDTDEYVCEWLKNLMQKGLIRPGYVDCRPIEEVTADDVREFIHQHYFAGLGGWAYAAHRVGWPDDRPLVSGSCPCQPFSVAGKQQGFADKRHIWPEFRRLIDECETPTVVGEQVASASEWLGLVRRDLEAMGYAVGVCPIEAASAGAPHYRDRYFFVGVSDRAGRDTRRETAATARYRDTAVSTDPVGGVMAHDMRKSRQRHGGGFPTPQAGEYRTREFNGRYADRSESHGENGSPMAHHHQGSQERGRAFVPECASERRVGPDRAGHRGDVVDDQGDGWGEGWTEHDLRSRGFAATVASVGNTQILECPDGKWRRLPPPRVRWLGTGIPARVPRLRALGNSLDQRAAQAFLRSVLETLSNV